MDGTLDYTTLAAAGRERGEGTVRLLRLPDTQDLFVLEDGGRAYDSLFALMAGGFRSGGGFLHARRIEGGPEGRPLLIQASATRAEGLVRGEEPAFAGQVLRVWLYAAGDGARESVELKRTREYTKIHKLPPVPTWPGLWPGDRTPPIEPAVLGWLRSLAEGTVP